MAYFVRTVFHHQYTGQTPLTDGVQFVHIHPRLLRRLVNIHTGSIPLEVSGHLFTISIFFHHSSHQKIRCEIIAKTIAVKSQCSQATTITYPLVHQMTMHLQEHLLKLLFGTCFRNIVPSIGYPAHQAKIGLQIKMVRPYLIHHVL